jgi:hypothetical protein
VVFFIPLRVYAHNGKNGRIFAMSYYPIALFLHVVGAVALFVTLGLEWTSQWQLRRVTSAQQVREWIDVAKGVRGMGAASMAVILFSGLYMMATVWSGATWIIVAFWSLVLLAVIAVVFSGPRLTALARAVNEENGPLSSRFHDLAHHPMLWVSIQVRVAIALGIVFLMTVKPDFDGSLLTIGVASVLGLAVALLTPGPARTQSNPAERPDERDQKVRDRGSS